MTELKKYPRTVHLPGSSGKTADDLSMHQMSFVHLSRLGDYVVTEKMDGGNLTMTRDEFFARSLDSGTHHWDTYARRIWAEKRWNIPVGWRVTGESLYARRSVAYDNLSSYFQVFAIFDENDIIIDWDRTESYCHLWGFDLVPVLYRGPDFKAARNAWHEQCNAATSEGYVIRYAGNIESGPELYSKRGKWVRPNHVNTRDDWRHRTDYAKNGLRNA